MKKYESMIMLSPTFSKEDATKENEKILKYITDNGGEIIEIDVWGKRRLAYEIRKIKEAFYFVNYYNIEQDKVKEFDLQIKLNENIIRHNILIAE